MADAQRKKSPRAPSISLNEALDRAMKIYEKERLHAAPIEVVANNMGYKSANNGAALSAIASLRYYGLLERPREGALAITKDVESFRFAPNEELRRSLLIQFLKTPPLFAELLDQYTLGLPSDPTLKYELIQKGFAPAAAGSALSAFKQSVEFSGYYDFTNIDEAESEESNTEVNTAMDEDAPLAPLAKTSAPHTSRDENDLDRIPVRLSGGRRAWLLIPTPLFAADKIRLKAQIDFLFAEDEDNL